MTPRPRPSVQLRLPSVSSFLSVHATHPPGGGDVSNRAEAGNSSSFSSKAGSVSKVKGLNVVDVMVDDIMPPDCFSF